LLLLAFSTSSMWSASEADETRARERDDRARTAESEDAVLPAWVERESAIQRRRHRERLEQLQRLRDALPESADDEREAVDRLIAEEVRDYTARTQVLRDLAVPAREPAPLSEELDDVARAIRRLNQSYAYAPVIGPGAATGGSYYIDATTVRRVDPREAGAPPRDLRLPPPVFVPSRARVRLPDWLYREADVVPYADETVDRARLRKLERALIELQRDVKELRKQTPPSDVRD
jgi:hypothetical protein